MHHKILTQLTIVTTLAFCFTEFASGAQVAQFQPAQDKILTIKDKKYPSKVRVDTDGRNFFGAVTSITPPLSPDDCKKIENQDGQDESGKSVTITAVDFLQNMCTFVGQYK